MEIREELPLLKCKILEMPEKLFRNGEEEMLEEILFLLLLKEIQDSDIITLDTIDIEIIDLSIIMEDIIQDIKDKIGLEEIEEEEEEDFKLKDYLFVSHWNE